MKKITQSLIATFTVTCLVATSPATADTGPLGFGPNEFQQEMETDRPDFTEGTQTVTPGHLQLESGYTFTYDKENGTRLREHVAPEFLLRVGLIQDLELRLSWDGYVDSQENSPLNNSNSNGVSDFAIGFKHRMYRQEDSLVDFSLIGDISIPAGSSEITSDEVEPGLSLLWARDLDEIFAIAGNLNFVFPVVNDDRYFQIENSLTLGTSLSERFGSYLEYYGLYPADSDTTETTSHIVNGGFTFLASTNLQFDIRAGFGLNDEAPDFLVGTGVTFRI